MLINFQSHDCYDLMPQQLINPKILRSDTVDRLAERPAFSCSAGDPETHSKVVPVSVASMSVPSSENHKHEPIDHIDCNKNVPKDRISSFRNAPSFTHELGIANHDA